jgi:hypothetical protein
MIWFLFFFFLNPVLGACVYVWLDAPERFNGALFRWFEEPKKVYPFWGQLLQIMVLQAWPLALYSYWRRRP